MVAKCDYVNMSDWKEEWTMVRSGMTVLLWMLYQAAVGYLYIVCLLWAECETTCMSFSALQGGGRRQVTPLPQPYQKCL